MRPAWRSANGSVPPPRAKPQSSPPVTPLTPAGRGELPAPSYPASRPPHSPCMSQRAERTTYHVPRTSAAPHACCGMICVIVLHIDGAAEGFVLIGGSEVRGPRAKLHGARCEGRGPRSQVPGPRAKNQVTRSTDHAARTLLPAPRSLVMLRCVEPLPWGSSE